MIDGVGGSYASMYMYQQEPMTDTTAQDSENQDDITANELDKDAKNKEMTNQEQIKSEDNLSLEEEEVVKKLQARDLEVKQHEAQHMATGGGLVRGGMKLDYSTGPDGQSYAVGGEVSIDISSGSTPEETASKMQQIKSAALAPSEPSGQDYAVAAQATAMEMDALAEATKEQTEETQKETTKKVEEKKDVEKKEDTDKENEIVDNQVATNTNNTNYYAQGIDIFA
jgi:hypothetical protein